MKSQMLISCVVLACLMPSLATVGAAAAEQPAFMRALRAIRTDDHGCSLLSHSLEAEAACLFSDLPPLRKLFMIIDANADGRWDDTELKAYLLSTGASHAPLLGEDDEPAVLADGDDSFDFWAHNAVDTNGDGAWTWEEFAARYARLNVASGDKMDPKEVHLSLTGNPSEMRVMWVTADKYAPGTKPFVKYGASPSADSNVVQGTSDTYTVPKRWWGGMTGWIHSAVMTLSPGEVVYYRVGGYTTSGSSLSPVFNFTMAPVPSRDEAVTFALYGDMGTIAPLGFAVTDEIIKAGLNFDLVMHVGDISYAGLDANIGILNITKADEVTFVWDLWGQQVQPIASSRPYMTSVGNHESFYNFTAYRHRFDMPSSTSGGSGNFWFSYDYGSVHVTSISTEHPLSPGTPQYAWIEADLAKAAANRDTVPWIMLAGHRPIYCSDQDEYSSDSPGGVRQTTLDPLLKKYGVDLTITGHMHCYERVHPVFNGTVLPGDMPHGSPPTYVNPSNTMHLVVGTSGAMQREEFVSPAPAWSGMRAADKFSSYGYGRMQFINSTHATFRFHGLDGSVLDEFNLQKTN